MLGRAPSLSRDANRLPASKAASVHKEVEGLFVVYRPAPMTEVIGRGASPERFALVLMGTFALVSVLLAALGLRGVLALTVRQRTSEIVIRMALGASAEQARTLVFRPAAGVVVLGLAAGLTGALTLGR
jgi:putative ABC transport system permease protein